MSSSLDFGSEAASQLKISKLRRRVAVPLLYKCDDEVSAKKKLASRSQHSFQPGRQNACITIGGVAREVLVPATEGLREIFALRRILLKISHKTDEELNLVRKFLAERTTIWRELFWAPLTIIDQLKIADCAKLRMVPRDGDPHTFAAVDSASGGLVVAALKGTMQVQCFDKQGTRLEFLPHETFGFLPVPEILVEDAMRNIEKVKANPRSNVFRGERDYTERRKKMSEAGRIRVKVAPGSHYLYFNGENMIPMLTTIAERHGRTHLMKSMGLLHLGVGGGSVFEGDGKKQREALTRETRYGVGSILVEEGAPPSTVFIILEGECRIVKAKAVGVSKNARYNLRSGKSNKVDVVLSSGFHTQVDVCHLGCLGPKALVGDIPALLGGVQPASVVAKTTLRVLQCRADKFSSYLEHNAQAKTVYMEAAKARKTWMEQRGAEVERLISLAGTPLLVDVGEAANGDDGGSGKAIIMAAKGATEHVGEIDVRAGEMKTAAKVSQKSKGAVIAATSGVRSTVRDKQNYGAHSESVHISNSKRARSITLTLHEENVSGESTMAISNDARKEETFSTAESKVANKTGSHQELDKECMVATASTSLLPSSSLGFRFESRQGRTTAGTSEAVDDGFNSRGGGIKELASALTGDLPVAAAATGSPSSRFVRSRRICTRGESSITGGARLTRSGSWHTSSEIQRRGEGRKGTLPGSMLASYLTPVPTITKNRSLHAVAQPLVPHSEGFADACCGEDTGLGMVAWRSARADRYDGLVAQADRLSIARQIQAGFNALQGRRVFPAA